MTGLIKSGGLKSRPLRARDIHAYYFCDILAGFLIQFMLVFSPWAFGTTEPWSIWTMNLCGYALGILLLVKSSIRFFKGYCVNESDIAPNLALPRLTLLLALCSCAILGYCLLAALNARATYDPGSLTFTYHNHI